ncbi:MAG TPA: hypothetical protein VIH71_09605, partial [Solirubrobacteraceae bacterium]
TYRLESYVLLELSAAILAALVLARGSSWRVRAWRWMALPVCVVSLLGAIQQIRAYPYPGVDRYDALKSYAEFPNAGKEAYQNATGTVFNGRALPTLVIPLSKIHANRASVVVRARPGTLAATNIAAGADLISVTGAQPVGIDSLTGQMVLRIGSAGGAATTATSDARGSTGPVALHTISVSTGKSLPIVLGRLLSLGALAALASELALVPLVRLLARWIRIRRVPQQASDSKADAKLTESNV